MPKVTLASANPKLTVTLDLLVAVDRPLPRPKIEMLDRFGFYDLPKYAGQQPFELGMYTRLGGEGASVEDEIRRLERMMERPEGRDAPPEVRVDGPIPHESLTWWLTSIVEDKPRTVYEPRSGGRLHAVTFVSTLTLIQRVTDTAGVASVNAAAKSKGIGTTTKVRKGEDDLYDVAQRFYRNSSFALAISKANPVKGNPMPLGTRLRAGQTLRMP